MLQLTPISLQVILRGKQKERELSMKERDNLNYYLACYILNGLGGKMPNEPYLSKLGVEEKQKTDLDVYEYKKAKFLEQMSKVNRNFKGKE